MGKNLVSEHLWAVDMLKFPKHCLNLHGSSFVIFLDYSEKHISWLLWKTISSKKSVLAVCEMLRLFVNILTPDDKYSFSVKVSVSSNQFKYNYLEIEKYFLNFFLHFWNLHKILNSLKKKWASEGICSWNYRPQKAELHKCLKPLCQNTYGQ